MALVEIVAHHVDDDGARPVLAHCMAGPDQILAQRCAARSEAVDAHLSGKRARKPTLGRLGIGHHARLNIRIADHGDERQRIVASVILIVDEARIVDAVTRDRVHRPAVRIYKITIRSEMKDRLAGIDGQTLERRRHRQEAQHDFGDTEKQDKADERRE